MKIENYTRQTPYAQVKQTFPSTTRWSAYNEAVWVILQKCLIL